MADLKANLHPYDLEVTLATDRVDNDCFVLDFGRDSEGNKIASLNHVIETVDDYLLNVHDLAVPITKLYIVGDWNLARPDTRYTETEEQESQEDGASSPRALPGSLKAHKQPKYTEEENEWHTAAEEITQFIAQMPMLKELTWVSGLPFVTCVLEKLPSSMTKLILDLGQGIRLHQDQDGVYSHMAYITPTDMKPLPKMTELRELRLFGMNDSLQPVVWETVYRNQLESGMRVLDLQMAAAPICRSGHWRKAQDVVNLTVVNEDSKEKEYKGTEGKGILHYSFGTGEYLDDFCMRKARIASGLDEAKPLPLLSLKLDGFVIDHLPFEHELSRIVLLTCGNNCVDAGLRAPKMIPDAAAQVCLIQWPRWTGVLDDQDGQRNLHDDVLARKTEMTAAVVQHATSSTRHLTEKALCMKKLDENLDGIMDDSYFKQATLPSAAARTPLGAVSNVSTRSSDVPTPPITASTHNLESIPAVDGCTASSPASSADPSLIMVDSTDTSATDESFQQVNPQGIDGASNATTDDNEILKAAGFKHKVRRSWGWLTGSASS